MERECMLHDQLRSVCCYRHNTCCYGGGGGGGHSLRRRRGVWFRESRWHRHRHERGATHLKPLSVSRREWCRRHGVGIAHSKGSGRKWHRHRHERVATHLNPPRVSTRQWCRRHGVGIARARVPTATGVVVAEPGCPPSWATASQIFRIFERVIGAYIAVRLNSWNALCVE